MRLRTFVIIEAVLQGGLVNAKNIPTTLLRNVWRWPGHYRAFLRLLRNAASWEAAAKAYGDINVPVLIMWGDRDWARRSEREHDSSLIRNAQTVTVEDGGHFLPFDRPDAVIEQIKTFATLKSRQ
jgi:pimeloyl-ACP methyl ester carboxylesterase